MGTNIHKQGFFFSRYAIRKYWPFESSDGGLCWTLTSAFIPSLGKLRSLWSALPIFTRCPIKWLHSDLGFSFKISLSGILAYRLGLQWSILQVTENRDRGSYLVQGYGGASATEQQLARATTVTIPLLLLLLSLVPSPFVHFVWTVLYLSQR